jgi:formylglycine-generating enzyme required for sulfatase activity
LRRWILIAVLLGLTAFMGLGAADVDDPDAEFDDAGMSVRGGRAQAAHAVAPTGFAYIRAGTYVMGSPSAEVEREDWNDDEARHWVTLTHDIFVQETEVTQALWMRTVTAAVPDHAPPFRFHRCGESCPAESVTWFQAVAFANLYTAQNGDRERCYQNPDGADYNWQDAEAGREVSWEGGYGCKGFRLPTEAEWEFAARDGGPTQAMPNHARDRSEEELGKIAWYVNNSAAPKHGIDCSTWEWKQSPEIRMCGPQLVGAKRPNNRGLYDTMGNVWEWTWDRYGEYPVRRTTDPMGPTTGASRSIRGGSWYVHPDTCRSASRADHPANDSNGNLGLRLVQSAN